MIKKKSWLIDLGCFESKQGYNLTVDSWKGSKEQMIADGQLTKHIRQKKEFPVSKYRAVDLFSGLHSGRR